MTSNRWFAAAALLCGACAARPSASPARQAEVAARGAEVMPFDLSRTRHGFESLPDGGLQTVTANEAGDSLQVRLIQEHLKTEAARFSRGDFADPMAIHGHEMPGIAELRQGAASIRIEFSATKDGGRVRYTTADPALVAALHRWFAAQRMDHGVRD
ncbi:MAG TPA: hypothetical protein VGQ73_01505 [Gemmatimonadales bacterium]|nr:hypothetical protein [Gemmatimonadales bacterium]